MKATATVNITAAKLTSSTVAEPFAGVEYDVGTTYALGAIIKVAAEFAVYESLQNANIANTPNVSASWWRKIGVTEVAWVVGTTYGEGDTVSYQHRCYESLQAANTGNIPLIATTWWLDVGPTLRAAMFDLKTSTQTVSPSPLTVVFAPGQRIGTIGFVGLTANQIQISATSVIGGGAVYPNAYSDSATGIFDLNTREVLDGYDYCFEPFSTSPSLVVFDIPSYSDIIITAAITATSGNVKCGALVVGTSLYIGRQQSGAGNDGLNYSTIARDTFGTAVLIPRRTIPQTSQTVWVESARVNKVKQLRVDLNAVPALWTGIDDSDSAWFDAFVILGIYTKFEIAANYNEYAELSLILEEI